jgi:hypothetical protein
MVGTYSPIGKTFIIEDEKGNQLVGVVTEQEQIFTATDNDVREGMVYASDSGVSTGSKNIPAYRTTCGRIGIMPGESVSIPLSQYDKYDYTELQCIVAKFNTTLLDSVVVDKIVIKSKVYEPASTSSVADVLKNETTKSIDLNIINNNDDDIVVHYFTYREET